MPKLNSVNFSELYPTSPYLNCRIGLDYSPNEGETEQDVLNYAKKQADVFHEAKYPQFYKDGKPIFVAQSDENIVPEVKIDGRPLNVQVVTFEGTKHEFELQFGYLRSVAGADLKEVYNKKLAELK